MKLLEEIRGKRAVANGSSSQLLEVRNLRTQDLVAGQIERADRGPARRRGLLGRRGLDSGQGLWITPCEAVHTFGMSFAIDLIFLDRRNVVRKVQSSVPPWRMAGCLRAHSVLELAAGTLKEKSVYVGDTLAFSPAAESPDLSESL
jgi:uncharacterized membrane protein (UPF0127 family)